MKLLLDNLKEHIEVSSSLENELYKRSDVIEFKKGTIIHNAKDICKHSYFIEEGILRLYFIEDGEEISEFFFNKQEWVNSPRSFMEQKKDKYYLDVIDDCKLLMFSRENLHYLYTHFPKMEYFSLIHMRYSIRRLFDRISSLHTKNASERYYQFCENYKSFYHKIPLKMVATYLGVKPETLSRIRNH